MTSGTFERVRLFTDVEGITLEKWLDAENAGKDELARKILDAGLLVEHMIAEIPLDQNLADNSELEQLVDNANNTFGLIVCFGCNRAFESKDAREANCPNCGGELSKPQLTPPESRKNQAAEKTKKEVSPPVPKIKKETVRSGPKKQPAGKRKKDVLTPPVPPSSSGDDQEDAWLGSTGQDNTGRRMVKSK